jgi:transcription termination/antitermination protein NusG
MAQSVESSLPWFALLTQPKHEHTAERGLRQQGFETYLPAHNVKRRWSDRVKIVHTVLFPGYVFCRLASRDKLRALTSPAIRSIVSVGRDPVAVAESEIDAIRAVIASGRPVDLCPYLRVGEQVRITEGPFTSVRGVIVRTQSNWRVVVSVEALGCSVSVEVDAGDILPDRRPVHKTPPVHKGKIDGHLQA